MIRRLRPFYALLTLAGLLCGCEAFAPKQPHPVVVVPDGYLHANRSTKTAATAPVEDLSWWTRYGSAELNQLVDRALANNSDLRIATLQIAQAKIRADQAQAGGLPTINAPVRTVSQGGGGSSDTQQSSQASLQGLFRLDLWGEQSAITESAELLVWRAVHERENVQRNVIASVVSAYIGYLAANDGILIARENETVGKEILGNVEKRFALGDATIGELEQQRAALYSLQVLIPAVENQREEIKNTLARLAGTLPGNLQLTLQGLEALLAPSSEVGIPSRLLLRRPDIRMVEAKMRAANANIDLARARLLPPVDLSAQAGYSVLTASELFLPQNLFYNAVASLAVTIFDGGRREGEKAAAQAYYEEMIETYRQTIFQAVREVESALATQKSAQLRLQAQMQSTRAALHIFKAASDAYMLDAIDLSTLLDARRNYQRGQDDTQRLRAEWLRANVGLAQALGAGTQLNDVVDAAAPTGAARPIITVAAKGHITLAHTGVSLTPGPWEVELGGMVHRAAVLPVWRDLQTRYAADMKLHALRAAKVGEITDKSDKSETWYRVFVSGFGTRQEAESFCAQLQRSQHACKAVSG